MRELTSFEIEAVSGGEISGEDAEALAMTLGLIVLSPTPPVLAAGTVAILYYAMC